MNILYGTWMSKEKAEALQEHGWKLTLFKDDPDYAKSMEHYAVGVYPENNGLFMNHYYASKAEKEFDTPSEAMFEVEILLDVDVVKETDHDGASIHDFYWKNPNWNGFVPDTNYDWSIPLPPNSEENLFASGWSCAVQMYGVPETPRETAIELFKLRNAKNGNKSE